MCQGQRTDHQTQRRIRHLLSQVDEEGVPVMTAKAIAHRCGVHVQTVYNVRDRVDETEQRLNEEIRSLMPQ